MGILKQYIVEFLSQHGFGCSVQTRMGLDIICVERMRRCVVPVDISAASTSQAGSEASVLTSLLQALEEDSLTPIVITEDRWMRQGEMMRARLLAHLEEFTSVYARNCVVRKIDKGVAAAFLAENHSYGDAACKYRYGLYLKRCTGKKAEDSEGEALMAVATFSNARKWQKGDKTIRSYEWTRYASLPGMRISGGMGKVLKAFIKDVQPDDIMSYADLEWSEGKVYEQLGFVLEGRKEPVMFVVDGEWGRFPVKPGMKGDRFFQNQGSNKYRLKLTQYE